jgi:hypothetical protein
VCAALFLLVLAWLAVSNGLHDLRNAGTFGQHAEAVLQLASGLLSVAVVGTRIRWSSVSRPVRIAWVVALSATVGLSALVWGPPMPHIALLNVGVALLVAWALLWALGPGRKVDS